MHPQQKLIDGLEQLAAFLRDHPVDVYGARISTPYMYVFVDDAEVFAEAAKQLGGRKEANDSYFSLRHTFAGGVELSLCVKREALCEAVVHQRVVPAKPETVLPAEPERVEEVVEWVCPESVLK